MKVKWAPETMLVSAGYVYAEIEETNAGYLCRYNAELLEDDGWWDDEEEDPFTCLPDVDSFPDILSAQRAIEDFMKEYGIEVERPQGGQTKGEP